MIRRAQPRRDAARCAEIYAPYVLDAVTSFETSAPSAAQMDERMAHAMRTHPWLVHEHEGIVAGFAYATTHRERAAYRWAADVSIYLDGAHRRRGIGRALYDELLGRLRAQRFQAACAGITLPNAASVALHESFGFELVGVYRRIGFKAGAWRDVGWWQLQLLADDPPPEPLAPPPATP